MQFVCILALLAVSVFLRQITDGEGLFSCLSCTGFAMKKLPRLSSEAAGFIMNGKPALHFSPLICITENVDL